MGKYGKAFAWLALCTALLALAVDPARAAEASESDDFGSLLDEVPAVTSADEKKSDRPLGITFEGELRANVWYQYAGEHQWENDQPPGSETRKADR